METVENKYITVAYKLYALEDGEKDFVEEAKAERPFQFISGMGTTLEAFEKQVVNLAPGEKFEFTIASSDAYGEYDDDHIVDLPKQVFEIDGKFDDQRVALGNVVPLMTSDGQQINGTILNIDANEVKVDLNHPLAGVDLIFTGEVIENRPATNEEIQQMANLIAGQGCGCGCDSCGSDCGDDCGCEGSCER